MVANLIKYWDQCKSKDGTEISRFFWRWLCTLAMPVIPLLDGRQGVERSHEVASEEPESRTRPKHWIPCQARNDNVFALKATTFGSGD